MDLRVTIIDVNEWALLVFIICACYMYMYYRNKCISSWVTSM